MGLPIYVFGSSNTDMVVKADKLPGRGETVIGGSFLMNPGGKGANQAVTAAKLGGKVKFIAKVGNDIFGKQAIKQFQRENIDTTFVSIDDEFSSGVALINVDKDGENSIVVAPGSNSRLTVQDAEQALEGISTPSIVLIQLEIPIRTVEYVIQRSHEKKLTIILNPAPAQSLSKETIRQVHIITPNESEAELLTGVAITTIDSARKAAKIIYDMGVPNVVITLGVKGAYVFNQTVSKLVPSPPVTAIDTTAAGDCFNGALAVALSEDLPLDEAVAFACKAAAISVTRMGAQSSLPYRKEIDNIPLVVSNVAKP
jgi:ribokinase